MINKKIKTEFSIFFIAGLSATIIDFLLYNYLLKIFPIIFSKAFSMITSSLFSYYINKNFTFNKKGVFNKKYFFKFYIVFLLNLFINSYTNFYLYKYSSQKLLSFLIATFLGMLVNFIGQKFFVFKNI